MRRLLSGLVLPILFATTVWGQAPSGAEFQVNSYTSAEQTIASVASDASGNFVVVWGSYGQDGSGRGIFGRRFNAANVPQGAEFRVNSYTTNFQSFPRVALDANGNVVVVWENGQDGSSSGISGQRYNALGVAQGGEFQVNSYTTNRQANPRVSSDPGGNFVVVWASGGGQDGSLYGVFGQRFDAAGSPQGTEFRVNTYTSGNQYVNGVASDASGNFVVVWQSNAQDGSNQGIFGRRFDASGTPQASEFRVNTYTTLNQQYAAVTSDSSGNFVVVWSSALQDGDSFGVFGQRFDGSGVAQGSEFRVNSYTTGAQYGPSIASTADGSFVVVWTSNVQDGSAAGIFGRRFGSDGVAQGNDFQVNSFTTGFQRNSAIASSPDGDFVAVWDSDGRDGSGFGVFGQRYGDILFEDGFESGDLSRWSSASTDGFDLSVSGPASMAGTPAGLQAFVNDTNALFVQDDTPNAENRYRARFYFDPNGFDPGEAQSHFRTRIFIGFDVSGIRLITFVLKRQAGAYSVAGRVRRNDGTRADTGFFPITDGPHFFEFDWIRSSAPGASDGSFTLRIDNAPVSVLTLLDNDASPVDFVRMGALSIKTGAAGTLYYDQFESRRQVFIGPE